MEKSLRNQLEQIMDESDGAYSDVIIQFKSEGDQALTELLEAAVATERSRAMSVEPHHMLPPSAEAFTGSRRAKRLLRQQSSSLIANIALHHADRHIPGITTHASVKMAKSLVASPEFKSAHDSISRRLRSRAHLAAPKELSNIGGMRLMVHRGDLPKVIGEQSDNLAGVFANAEIKPPPVVESKALAESSGPGTYRGTTWGLEQSRALAAWSAFGTRGTRIDGTPIRVAVLDTGTDPKHPDIKRRLVDFAEFDKTGNIVKRGKSNARDSGRHGTHVAGTIAGGNASGGWIGVAPDAELISGLVLDGSKGGSLAQVISGINWAVEKGAHVINMSLGGMTFEPSVGTPYQRAIVDALVRGSLVVAAIGNDGHQTTGAPGNDYFSLAVAAHDARGRCAGFSGGRTHSLDQSNFIRSQFLPLVYTKPDLSAPGVDIKSCVPGGKWSMMNGTSMATPHVAGAAALLFAATSLVELPPERRAFAAKDLMLGGVSDLGEAGQDQRFGHGSLNILRTIDEALGRGF